MRKEILHIRNKEYVYVLTNNNGNEKEIDISMFEIEEWADLTRMSSLFEETVLELSREKDDTYCHIHPNINVYSADKVFIRGIA